MSWMLWLDLAVGRGLEAFVLPNAALCCSDYQQIAVNEGAPTP